MNQAEENPHSIEKEAKDQDESKKKQENESDSIKEIIESILCPICYFAMTPPLRVPMVTPECGHTFCSECISKINACPLCKQNFSQPVKNVLACQVAEILQKKGLIPIEINPPPPAKNKLIPKIEGICTYFATGEKGIYQKWFQCKTCHITEETGFCEVCANACHKGHNFYLVREGPGFYCNCGASNFNCRCNPKIPKLRCTAEMTYGQPVDQPMYQCFECKITGENYICQHCAINCHYAHKLRYIGIVKNKICSCFDHSTCKMAQRKHCCTYLFSGSKYIRQPWCHCKTCGLVGDSGCCLSCAQNCHKGHDVQYLGLHERCYCDCGEGGIKSCPKCQICSFPNTSYLNCCTNIDHSDKPKEQRMYYCYSCAISGDYGICEACAINCHINHYIKYVGVRSFTCLCREGCQMQKIPILHDDRTICDRKVLEDNDVSPCYTCYTCDPTGEKQICETCALKKHIKHDIHLIGYIPFKCCEGGVFK